MFQPYSSDIQRELQIPPDAVPYPIQEMGINVHRVSFRSSNKSFVIPKIPVSALDDTHRLQLARTFAAVVPDLVRGCYLCDHSSIGITPHTLEWIRPLTVGNNPLVYVIRIAGNYLGGAKTEEVVEKGDSYWYSSFETDRIYYEAFLTKMVVKRSAKKTYYQINPLLEAKSIEKSRHEKFSFGLFDEIDLSKDNETLSNIGDVTASYHYHKIFPIFLYFHFSPALNLFNPTPEVISPMVQSVDAALELLYQKKDLSLLSESNKNTLKEYIQTLTWKESLTRSGLRCWTRM